MPVERIHNSSAHRRWKFWIPVAMIGFVMQFGPELAGFDDDEHAWVRPVMTIGAVLFMAALCGSISARVLERKAPRWLLAWPVAMIIFFVAILGAAVLDKYSAAGSDALIWIGLVAFAVLLIVAFPLVTFLYDEVRLRAHLDAWFRGGSVGLSLVLFCAFSVMLLDASGSVEPIMTRLTSGDAHPLASSLGFGVLATLAPILLGYGVWWTVWWLRRL